MAPIPNNPRSSDSNVDLEHAATMKELGELMLAEREYESPQELAASMLVFPGRRSQPVSIASSRTSRSNSRVSQRSEEKIVVFKDENDGRPVQRANQAPIGPSVSSSRSTMEKKLEALHAHSQSNSDSSAYRMRPANVVAQHVSKAHPHLQAATTSPDAQSLVEHLHSIAEERAQLLRRLTTLNEAENEILARLAHSIPPSASGHSRTLSNENAVLPASAPRTVPAERPVLPAPSEKLPPLQPSKTARTQPRLPRPVSAPPKSTPSGSQHRTPSTSKRIPLGDKTDASLAPFDSAPAYTMEQHIASPGRKSPDRAPAPGEASYHPTEEATPARPGRPVQVPTKFGDDEEEEEEALEAHGQKRGRPGTPARVSRSYDVPPTVARKRWAF